MTSEFYGNDVFDPGVDFDVQDERQEVRSGSLQRTFTHFLEMTSAALLTATILFSPLTTSAQHVRAIRFPGVRLVEQSELTRARLAASERLFATGVYRAAAHPSDDEPLPDYGF